MKILVRFSGVVLLWAHVVIVQAATLPGVLVDATWLQKNFSAVTVLDVRADVKSFTASPVYVKDKKTGKKRLVRVGGHIPRALLVNYKNVRAERVVNGKKVTRLAPTRASFEKLMQTVGLNKGSSVVIVSKGLGNGDLTMATRLYWQLKYFGQSDLAILDGGMVGWLKSGGKVSTTTPPTGKGTWLATAERKELLATSDEVAAAVKTGSTQLVDTRPLHQYFGTAKKSYVFAKGHIPGAKPFPNELLTRPSAPATFTSVKELRAMASELGIDSDKSAITYCNSGHLASGSWFVLHELMGNKNVKLYDGSMHQWTLENRPVTSLKLE